MSDYPKYWKGAFNRQLGLAVMRQKSATENSQMIAHICLHEREASELADALIATLNTNYAAVEKLLHDVIDVLRHANKCFPLTSAQIVLARYLKLYPKGRRTK